MELLAGIEQPLICCDGAPNLHIKSSHDVTRKNINGCNLKYLSK